MNDRRPVRENREQGRREQENQDVCRKAPEYAEHHRLQDDDMPCEDGRAGGGESDD